MGLEPSRRSGIEASYAIRSMTGEESRSVADELAASVKQAIESATRRVEEIVAGAEQEAERIRARAEADARERVERAQEAVDRLLRQADELRAAVSALDDATGPAAKSETPAPEVDPTPATVPEPEPPREPEPMPPPTPEPQPPLEPEPQPPEVPEPAPPGGGRRSTVQLIEQLKGGEAQPDEAGARLVAMNLALDGKPREEVERRLAEDYALEDSSRILDDVYSRVGK
jgi:outer membrane biosynthesis protein TonB